MNRPTFPEDPHPGRPDAFWRIPHIANCGAVMISTKDSKVTTTLYLYEGNCDSMKLLKWADSGEKPGKDYAITGITGEQAGKTEHVIIVSGEPGPVALHVRAFPEITTELQAILENNYDLENSDTNQDGRVDVADIITILQTAN